MTKGEKRPRCDVLLLNDEETTMEFVILVLERFFGMSNLEAITHMGRIHEEGHAICGTYWCDVAKKKAAGCPGVCRRAQTSAPVPC